MALATTCPQCKTSFKVVPDQLKLRRGLVRCGVCQHVFSGVEHLRYVDKDEKTEKATPAAGTPSAPVTTIEAPAPTPADAAAAPAVESAQPGTPLDRLPPEQVLSVTEVPDLSMPGEDAATEDGASGAPDAVASHDVQTPHGAHDRHGERHTDDGSAAASHDRATAGHDDAGEDDDEPASPEAPPSASGAASHGPAHEDGSRRNSRSKRRWRRERERARQASEAAAQPDDEVHTQFFMADHEEPSDSAANPDSSRLPTSLRQDTGKADQDDLDPDTVAAGALIDEANKIWRQHQPRQAADAHGSSPDHGSHTTPATLETATDDPPPVPASKQPDEAASSRSQWLTPARARRLIIGLIVLAIIQLMAVFRTEIAYHLPFLRPVANMASSLTGQTIEAPMALASLSIESFELRGTEQPGQTRLTAILRNRSQLPARWPAMELTLTGPSNAVLVRKVMMPAHYLPVTLSIQDGIPASSEQPLDLLLDTGELNLAGYSVSLFYP
ncbi:MAG: DUF3426 domain-containing protein [Lautropia sp.]|nr:DUF3426 domain-containing protein [Lautropia sp.]